MKARLLHRDRDVDFTAALPGNAAEIIADIGLAPLFAAMAGEDEVIRTVVPRVFFESLDDRDAIAYRQDIVRDSLANRDIVRQIYALAIEANERERKHYLGLIARYPAAILHRSIDVLAMFVELLGRLRKIADRNATRFHAEGFRTLFAILQWELDDDYFAELRGHLANLHFRRGILISAGLGPTNKGVDYVLREPARNRGGWIPPLFGPRAPSFSFRIHERDEAGARALSELNDRGINLVANAAAQACDHILGFFRMMREELAFYVGCIALEEKLAARGQRLCFPVPEAAEQRVHAFQGLYDVSLALSTSADIVANDGDLSGKAVVVITGANQGGKSTFLRSLGLAQMMMQAGMFVGAGRFSANLCHGLHTHFKREEDSSMTSGKLDEELARMSAIVDRLHGDGLLLLNESFQSTDEREGSAIAREIVLALAERRIKVVMVTHLYDLARSLFERGDPAMAFLRAERRDDGTRSFRVTEGRPLTTSFGEDLYWQIFTESRHLACFPGRAEDAIGDGERM